MEGTIGNAPMRTVLQTVALLLGEVPIYLGLELDSNQQQVNRTLGN